MVRDLTDYNMHRIVALKPAPVNVTKVDYSNSGISVNGSAGTQEDILGYAQSLRDSGGFTTVVSLITYTPDITDEGIVIPYYTFNFQMQ